MISPGTSPDFNFPIKALRDGVSTELPFRELLTGRTVVSVYMRNNTSACDKQTASLVAHADEISGLGWRILAVSRDTCASHAKYAAKIGANFTLVSDPEDKVSRSLDAIVEKSMYGKKYTGPARAAYLFDATGTTLAVIPKVDAPNHAAQVLAAIKAL
jgi:peroxiredoxin Q/BCP